MKRNQTKELSYMNRCIAVCMEDLPIAEAGQLATCVALLNQWKEKRDECQAFMDAQRRDILNILKSVRKAPNRYDYIVFTRQPELYGDLEGKMFHNIILTTTHGHTQMRFDTTRFKEEWPGIYNEYLKRVEYGVRVLTGEEITKLMNKKIEEKDG